MLEDSEMNKLPIEKRTQILGLLVEGNSIRAITRLVGCSIKYRYQALDRCRECMQRLSR